VKRHSPDSIGATVLLLLCGAVAFTLSRRWGVDGSLARQMAAIIGPLGLALGLGMAVHGAAMPTTHISRPARIWGLAGSLAGIVNLWSLGYFSQGAGAGRLARLLMPVALVVAWLLPPRFYGDDVASEPPATGTIT
jgi:hypothetical protein